MTTETGNTRNTTGYFVAAGAVFALAIGLALYLGGRNQEVVEPVPVANTTPPPSASDEAETGPSDSIEAPTAESDTVGDTPSEAKPAMEGAGAPSDEEPAAPGFDVVRVDPDGNAVIAGHAAPGSTVQLTLDGAPLEDVTVGSDGNFVALLDLPITEPGALGLSTLDDNGQVVENAQSPQTVLIAPTRPAPPSEDTPVPADDTPTPTPDPAPATAAVVASVPNSQTEQATETPVAGDTLAAAEANTTNPDVSKPSATAPQVLLADDEGIAVLQDGTGRPEVDNIVIDAITYDDAGDVSLSGRGQSGSSLRVYLDNEPIEIGQVSESGQWRVPLPEVDSGVYTLRVDELAEDGTVTSRTETPFKREEPAQLAAATTTDAETPKPRVEAVTVQPGSTLWAIAREHLGEGPLYVRVFAANRGQIRDPDLIYPGQVFTIPEPEQSGQ